MPSPASAAINSAASAKDLYRSFLHHLRLLPDPHVWNVLRPRFKRLLWEGYIAPERECSAAPVLPEQAIGVGHAAEGSNAPILRELRAARAKRHAQKELKKLRMAVACHPHALTRLLEESYGRRGAVRWQLINNIMLTSSPPISPTIRSPLPAPLRPHGPPSLPTKELPERARTILPKTATRRATARSLQRDWAGVKVPLVLPAPTEGSGPGTGWEAKGVVESLRMLAGLEGNTKNCGNPLLRPLDLPSFIHLAPRIQRIFPRCPERYTLPEPPYPAPRPRATRQNPGTWSAPRTFTTRLLSRTYKRLWNSLVWSRRRSRLNGADTGAEVWEACGYQGVVSGSTVIRLEGGSLPVGRAEDRRWLG